MTEVKKENIIKEWNSPNIKKEGAYQQNAYKNSSKLYEKPMSHLGGVIDLCTTLHPIIPMIVKWKGNDDS